MNEPERWFPLYDKARTFNHTLPFYRTTWHVRHTPITLILHAYNIITPTMPLLAPLSIYCTIAPQHNNLSVLKRCYFNFFCFLPVAGSGTRQLLVRSLSPFLEGPIHSHLGTPGAAFQKSHKDVRRTLVALGIRFAIRQFDANIY